MIEAAERAALVGGQDGAEKQARANLATIVEKMMRSFLPG
jgi:hypothetical protein